VECCGRIFIAMKTRNLTFTYDWYTKSRCHKPKFSNH